MKGRTFLMILGLFIIAFYLITEFIMGYSMLFMERNDALLEFYGKHTVNYAALTIIILSSVVALTVYERKNK